MIEEIRRKRILISIYAYAYEICDDPIITDSEYDKLSRELDVTTKTGNSETDKFFKETFKPDTGMWIRHHPHINRIGQLYDQHFKL